MRRTLFGGIVTAGIAHRMACDAELPEGCVVTRTADRVEVRQSNGDTYSATVVSGRAQGTDGFRFTFAETP